MLNAANCGVFYQCEEYSCILHIILLRAHFHKMWNIGMKYVTYWYQFFTRCEELVQIVHGVKFAKCVCGLIRLAIPCDSSAQKQVSKQQIKS